MTGDSTTSRCGVEQRQQRLPQHPIKTDEIEILESAGGEDTQPDKVNNFLCIETKLMSQFISMNVIDFSFRIISHANKHHHFSYYYHFVNRNTCVLHVSLNIYLASRVFVYINAILLKMVNKK